MSLLAEEFLKDLQDVEQTGLDEFLYSINHFQISTVKHDSFNVSLWNFLTLLILVTEEIIRKPSSRWCPPSKCSLI